MKSSVLTIQQELKESLKIFAEPKEPQRRTVKLRSRRRRNKTRRRKIRRRRRKEPTSALLEMNHHHHNRAQTVAMTRIDHIAVTLSSLE